MKVETAAPQAWQNKTVERLPLLKTPQGESIDSLSEWQARKKGLQEAWRQYLGQSPFADLPLDARVGADLDLGDCVGREIHLQMEPDYYEQCYLLLPKVRKEGRLPAVVVFYYDIDVPVGHDFGSRLWKQGQETRQFARQLAARGYVTFVQRWVHEGYVAQQGADGAGLQLRYARSVDLFQRRFPNWKGLGRVAWDGQRCIDFLLTQEFVDPQRIGCMGHSLGGKMALYASAFDERYRVVVSSELGIGLSFSNWEAPWYLGPEIEAPDFSLDHHQLLSFLAPRSFLLIAGEDADGEVSWPYLNSAQEVYALYDAQERIGMVNHRSGHAPTAQANQLAYDWFDRWL